MKKILASTMLLALTPVAHARDWQAELDRCRALREQKQPLLLAGQGLSHRAIWDGGATLHLDRTACATTWCALGAKTLRGRMTYWTASIVAVSLASVSSVASAQNCEAIPAGPARADCYIGLSRVYRRQSDVAAGNARVQSVAARLQQVTGTGSSSKASRHRRSKATEAGPE